MNPVLVVCSGQEVGSLNVRVITSFALNYEVFVAIDGT